MHPRSFELVCLLEHRIGYNKLMLSTQGKKSETTRVHIANAMLTDDLLP
jgi:hypothetical protein